MTTPVVPETPATPAAPSGPVKVDPLNPSVQIPVYLGGEGPVPTPPAGDRGDTVGTPVAAAPAAESAAPEPVASGAAPAAAAEPAAPAAAAAPAVAAVPATPDAAAPAVEAAAPADPAAPVEPAAPVRNEKGQFIPRARFNEVNERMKLLAEENATLKAEKGATAAATEGAYDFDAKEAEYINLVLDGKAAEAAALRKEIRTAEKADYESAAKQATVKVAEQLTVKDRIEKISNTYAEANPQFDPESDQYNEELLNDVSTFYRGSLESGRYPDGPTAFEESIKKAMRLHGIAAPDAAPVQAAAAPAAAAPAAAATPPAPARTAEKRVQAIVSQPPSLSNVGTTGAPESATTIDVRGLTDEQFRALPPATKARLRGDTV